MRSIHVQRLDILGFYRSVGFLVQCLMFVYGRYEVFFFFFNFILYSAVRTKSKEPFFFFFLFVHTRMRPY